MIEGWKKVKIKQICRILKGKGLSKEKLVYDGKYKCILYGELFTKYDEVISTVISRTHIKEGTVSKRGDILIPGSTTTVGIDLARASALNEEGIYLGGDINILRKFGNSYTSKYLSYCITYTQKTEIAKIAQGITIIHLYGRDLGELEILLPPLSEQSKIVDILTKVDEAIDETEAFIAKQERMKQGLMRDLLNPEELPEGWKKDTLGKHSKITMGQSPNSEDCNESGKGYPFLQGNADFGTLYPNPVFYCTKTQKIAKKEEILVSVRAPVGDLNIANQDYCIGRGLCSIRENKNMDRNFVYYSLVLFKGRLLNRMQGTTFEAVNSNDLFFWEINIPEKKEQERISKRLKSIDQKIESEQTYLNKLLKMKTGLMQDLLTGKLRVKVEAA